MSSKIKYIPGRLNMKWKDTLNSFCINQMRTISTARILNRKGRLSDNKLKSIKQNIVDFYNLYSN